MTTRDRLRSYYLLTKPGIVYGNTIVGIAAYLLGSAGNPHLGTIIFLIIGLMLVIASACVFNNVLDQKLDRKMKRTERRALVTGAITLKVALLYASVLLLLGISFLFFGTNLLSAFVALCGHIAYVALYGYAKRTTVHGTLVGTISGSTPPVIGYTAATGQLDITAGLLFLVLVAWQMPHFYAIAIFRRDDYKAAKIPVLPVVRGVKSTRTQIIVYVLLFLFSIISLFVYSDISLLGTMTVLLAGSYWLYLCLLPYDEVGIDAWARRQFVWSLKLLMIFSVIWGIDSFLH